ncbi:MAG: DUF424 family protein [archaeon]|nr:MAG: DUF424 family protein [archaeon]
MVVIKVHDTYRKVVAICDSELVGKKFEQDNLELDINDKFYGGKEYSDEKALEMIKWAITEDACFNFVGKNSVELGVKAGIIDRDSILTVQGISHALSLM